MVYFKKYVKCSSLTFKHSKSMRAGYKSGNPVLDIILTGAATLSKDPFDPRG